jgi:hypothetical protein
MSTDPTHDDSETPRDADEAAPELLDRPALRARLARYDDEPDVLTLSPVDVRPTELSTTWISAAAGSFVDLQEWR